MLMNAKNCASLTACVVSSLSWSGSALAVEPVSIFHAITGSPIVCTSDNTPALYDVGTTREGETEKTLIFGIGNNSKRTVEDVVITVSGSQVPDNFWVYYNNNRGYLPANSGCSVTIKFRPSDSDPSGTVYGGDASKILIRVTYTYKPDKGPKRAGTPLELVLTAHKR